MLVMWSLRWNGWHYEEDHHWAVCDPDTGHAIPTRWSANSTDNPWDVYDDGLPGCGSVFWSIAVPVSLHAQAPGWTMALVLAQGTGTGRCHVRAAASPAVATWLPRAVLGALCAVARGP